MPPLKILIVGAGVAGTSLAHWFSKSKSNHDITVIERFPNMRDTGLQIDLRGPGIEVLKRMGLDAAFRAKSIPEQGFQMVDSSDRVWAFFRANKTGEGMQSLTSDYEIMRGDLCKLIRASTESNPRVKYLFETSMTSFTELPDDQGVEVTLVTSASSPSNGGTTTSTTATFDLVIGADGQNSHTRKMLLAAQSGGANMPDSDVKKDSAIHHTGIVIAYFTLPVPIPSASATNPESEYVAKAYTTTNHRFIFTRRHDPHTLQVYLICTPPPNHPFHTVPKGDVVREKLALASIFAGAGWKTDEILEKMMMRDGVADDFYCERLGLVQMERWFSDGGRVVLAGDAAHCPTAFTGMGTTSAMVGCFVLAGEVERVCSRARAGGDGDGDGDGERVMRWELEGAVRRYDEVFRPFMSEVQKGIEENRMMKRWPRGQVGIFVLRCLAALFVLLRMDVIATWFLAEGAVEKWVVPDYEY